MWDMSWNHRLYKTLRDWKLPISMMTYACCKCKFVTSLTNQIFVSLYGVKMASIDEISSVSFFLDSLEAVIHHEIFSIASKCNLNIEMGRSILRTKISPNGDIIANRRARAKILTYPLRMARLPCLTTNCVGYSVNLDDVYCDYIEHGLILKPLSFERK